jgi:hypothetical protein
MNRAGSAIPLTAPDWELFLAYASEKGLYWPIPSSEDRLTGFALNIGPRKEPLIVPSQPDKILALIRLAREFDANEESGIHVDLLRLEYRFQRFWSVPNEGGGKAKLLSETG